MLRSNGGGGGGAGEGAGPSEEGGGKAVAEKPERTPSPLANMP